MNVHIYAQMGAPLTCISVLVLSFHGFFRRTAADRPHRSFTSPWFSPSRPHCVIPRACGAVAGRKYHYPSVCVAALNVTNIYLLHRYESLAPLLHPMHSGRGCFACLRQMPVRWSWRTCNLAFPFRTYGERTGKCLFSCQRAIEGGGKHVPLTISRFFRPNGGA